MLPHNKIEAIVNKIQSVYLFFVCVDIFFFIWEVLGSLRKFERIAVSRDPKDILMFSIYLILYLGLRYRQKWVVPFALLISAFGVFRMLLFILSPIESLQFILAKIFGVLLIMFFGYQLLFFSKGEVRKYFQSEGTVLF